MSELRPLDCTISLAAEYLSLPLCCLFVHYSEETLIAVTISAMELQKELCQFRDLNISVDLDLNSKICYNETRNSSHSGREPFIFKPANISMLIGFPKAKYSRNKEKESILLSSKKLKSLRSL